jgi:phage terminase small subunit
VTQKLTPKQQRFVEEYLVDLNATQAAVRAGYSEKTANQQGSRLLANVGVAQAIQSKQAKRLERAGIDAEWVLQRLALEADADLADLYEENGALKPVKEWPLVWRKGLVAGIETQQEFEQTEEGKRPAGVIHKVKLSDRIKRLELIGKHVTVGAFSDRHEHSGPNGGPIETKDVSDNEAARRIAFTLAKGMQVPEKPH